MFRFDQNPPLRMDSGIRLDASPAQENKHPMADPALKLDSKTRNDKKILAGSMATGLTDNPTLVPSPKFTPAQLTAAAKAVTDQEVIVKEAEDNLSAQRRILKEKDDALDATLTASAGDSANAVEHDGTKLALLNVPIAAVPGTNPPPPATAPQNFHVSHGDHTSEADGQCNAAKGSKMYRAQWATNVAGPWTTGYEDTRSRFTMTGLPVGQELWFRMAAFIGGRWTDWSDVASLRIL